MRRVYAYAYTALRQRGYLMLVEKDHIRKGVRMPTVMGTIALCEQVGFLLYARHQRLVWPLSLGNGAKRPGCQLSKRRMS